MLLKYFVLDPNPHALNPNVGIYSGEISLPKLSVPWIPKRGTCELDQGLGFEFQAGSLQNAPNT